MKTVSFLLMATLLMSDLCASAQSTGKKLNELFILGTLQDYRGRTLDPRFPNLVDRYDPSEGQLMSAVDSVIKVTYPQKEHNLLKKERNIFSSDFLAKRFNAYYDFKPSGSYSMPARKEILTGTLKNNIFQNDREKLAFLAGAFVRFGHISDTAYSIRILNSASKAKLCHRLLQELGCKSYYTTRQNYIPAGHDVFFHPTSKVSGYLKRYGLLHKRLNESRKAFIMKMLDEGRQKRSSN